MENEYADGTIQMVSVIVGEDVKARGHAVVMLDRGRVREYLDAVRQMRELRNRWPRARLISGWEHILEVRDTHGAATADGPVVSEVVERADAEWKPVFVRHGALGGLPEIPKHNARFNVGDAGVHWTFVFEEGGETLSTAYVDVQALYRAFALVASDEELVWRMDELVEHAPFVAAELVTGTIALPGEEARPVPEGIEPAVLEPLILSENPELRRRAIRALGRVRHRAVARGR